jgi:chemotaxis-related protein WspD
MSITTPDTSPPENGSPEIDACWSRIGVQGNQSCPELPKHIHCRNCPTYTAAAHVLLDRPITAEYRNIWASHFAAPAKAVETEHRTCLLFRVQAEWLALPSAAVQEVTESRPVRSLPHRRNDAVLGLINLRGQLVVSVSLVRVLGITQATIQTSGHIVFPRLLVVGSTERRIALPVDEVFGTWRYAASELGELPGTVARAALAQCTGMLQFNDHPVGLLDPGRLLPLLDRVVA